MSRDIKRSRVSLLLKNKFHYNMVIHDSQYQYMITKTWKGAAKQAEQDVCTLVGGDIKLNIHWVDGTNVVKGKDMQFIGVLLLAKTFLSPSFIEKTVNETCAKQWSREMQFKTKTHGFSDCFCA